jgi:hypothetical protein
MAKRTSLAGNVSKPDTLKAVEVARKIAGQAAPVIATDDAPEYETVSYNLPLDLIDLCRDLATERHRIDQAAKRDLRRRIKAAKKVGNAAPLEAPQQARQSASAVVREALESHRDTIVKELANLQGR